MGWEKKFTEMNMDTWIAWLVEARCNEIIINTVSFHCVCINMYTTRDNVFVLLVCGSWSLKVVHTVHIASFLFIYFFFYRSVPQECSYLQIITELAAVCVSIEKLHPYPAFLYCTEKYTSSCRVCIVHIILRYSYTSRLTFVLDPLVNGVMGKSCLGTCFTLESKEVWVNSVMDVNTA
jgi:hypothetical protein